MGKWNFDVIFTGTNEEQEIKATRFRTGISYRVKEACGAYANAVLYGEDPGEADRRLAEVREYEAAHEAMCADPRGVALRAWQEKREKNKQADEITEAVLNLLRR